jgi:hypothetical protein
MPRNRRRHRYGRILQKKVAVINTCKTSKIEGIFAIFTKPEPKPEALVEKLEELGDKLHQL